MLPCAMRMLSKTISAFSISPAMWLPISSNLTLKLSTKKVRTWKMDAWFMPAKLTKTSMPLAKQACGAFLCLADMAAWICLTSPSQCWAKLFRLPMPASKMCGACRAVSTHSMNSALKNNAKNTFLASLLAKPCRWTLPNLMQVPTFNAWCSKPLSMKKTIAGASMVWSASSPTATPTSTWCSRALKKAPKTVAASLCLSMTSVTAV